MMNDLQYGPLHRGDIASIQAMIQGTGCYCSIEFNSSAHIVFTAHNRGSIVGFISGQCGYDDESSTITLSTPFLYQRFNDAAHEQDMRLALINWAHENKGVTHYRLHDFDTPKPIAVHDYMPAPTYDITVPAAPVPDEVYYPDFAVV